MVPRQMFSIRNIKLDRWVKEDPNADVLQEFFAKLSLVEEAQKNYEKQWAVIWSSGRSTNEYKRNLLIFNFIIVTKNVF